METPSKSKKLNLKRTFVVFVLVLGIGVGLFLRAHTWISIQDVKITINRRIKYEINNDVLTLYIPINDNVSGYKLWVGNHHFSKDETMASRMVHSLDTSIPQELLGTIVVDRTPITLQLIVE